MTVRSDKLLAFHMPKTGGTWLTKYLCNSRTCHMPWFKHAPAYLCNSSDFEGRMAVGTLRDPWSWYVSWWYYAMNSGGSYREQLAYYGNGSLEFKDVLRGATNPASLRETPLRPGVLWWDTSRDCHAEWRQAFRDIGSLFTFGAYATYGRLDGSGWFVDAFIDMRQMAQALSDILGEAIDSARHPPVNTMKDRQTHLQAPEDPRHLYDGEMLAWVARADADIIEAGGWAPFGQATSAVISLH